MLKHIQYRLMFLRKLSPFAAGIKRFLILSAIISCISLALNFIQPMFYRMFIDQVILRMRINVLFTVIIGYLSICVINILIDYVKLYANNRIINRVVFRIKCTIWHNLFEQDFTQFEKQNVGDVNMKIEHDTKIVSSFADYQTVNYVISCITIFVSSILLFSVEWRLAIFSITVIPLAFYIDNRLSKNEKNYNEKIRVNDQEMSSCLHAHIQGWREVKALNLQKHEKLIFTRYIHKHGKYFAKWLHYWTFRNMIVPCIRIELIMQFGLYFLGGLLIIYQGLHIGDLLVFAIYYNMLSGAVKTVSNTDADLQSNMPFTDRLISEIEKNVEPIRTGLVPKEYTDIVFRDVSFSYPGTDKQILSGVNLKITKGERVAITGKSGSGKTTILKLMVGMLAPCSGQVFFSGLDMQKVDISSVHKFVGFVMQENMLFNASIRDNLLYGKPNATDEELIDACRKAFIYSFIETLPDGIDTIIGEQGIKLSGGQRQRIVLARQFLRDVDIYIFDEATNALDQYSENIVHDAIQSIAEDKTIIIVAHRQSSIDLCNRQLSVSSL